MLPKCDRCDAPGKWQFSFGLTLCEPCAVTYVKDDIRAAQGREATREEAIRLLYRYADELEAIDAAH